MIEEVKTILRNLEHVEYNELGNKFIDAALGIKQVNDTAQQICQKFPKTPDNPDGYEPSPIKGQVMGFKERPNLVFPPEYYEPKPIEETDAECQAKIEGILGLLPNIPVRFRHNATCFDCVEAIKSQALKEKELK